MKMLAAQSFLAASALFLAHISPAAAGVQKEVQAYVAALQGTLPQDQGAMSFTELKVRDGVIAEHIYVINGETPAYMNDAYFDALGAAFCSNQLIEKGAVFLYRFMRKSGDLLKEVRVDSASC